MTFCDRRCSRPSAHQALLGLRPACGGPPESTLMRPLVLDGPRGSLTQLSFVWLTPIAEVLENRCFTTPNDFMLRRPTKDQAWCWLVRDGQAGGSREDGGSANVYRLLIAPVPAKMGGSGHHKWPSAQVRGRREEGQCGARRCLDIVIVESGWSHPQNRCGRGGIGVLALASSAARRLGGSAA